ncbi:hypothetical protein PT974_03202 [Cladobotryum mycophilum]|uniref:Uncharacterized protein n=1 Tax=Cladobotryum mycophilum TaxID=491253 RepID=A0ABR0SRS6_9HYPO
MSSQTLTTTHSDSSPNLSISQLVRRHCRERLIVDPLHWTNRHLELLQCLFEAPSPAPPDSTANFCQDNLYFNFNQYRARTLHCVSFFPGNDQEGARLGWVPPVAAFVDQSQIEDQRWKSLYAGPRRRHSKPTSMIFELRLKKITPQNPLRDPYIFALLIGVAQRQRHVVQRKQAGAPVKMSTFAAKLMFSVDDDEDLLHLFSANIPSSLLDSLEYPTTLPPSDLSAGSQAILVRHMTLPYKPYKTFRNRLLLFLLPDTTTTVLGQDDGGIAVQCG